jgi:hypothetical protein
VPVPYFLLFLCFRNLHRKYSRNWTKQKPNLLFFQTRVGVQSRDEGGPGPGHTLGRRGQALAHATRGRALLVHLLTPPFRLYIPLDGKNLKPDQFSTKPTASRRRRRCEIGRVHKLFSAPYQRGESLLEAFFITLVTSGVMCE